MQPLTFTLIQTHLHWEDKAANLAMLEQKINSINQVTEVIVLPEMFSTGFSMQPHLFAEDMQGETVQWMKRIAQQKKAIITGSVIIQEKDNFYNRLLWMLPNGSYGCYDKRHLFAYAGEDGHYTPGNKRLIASVKGWKINLQICYDLRFPVWARQQTPSLLEKPGDEVEYDVLLYVANWPERRNHAWQTLLTARAIENQCYVIGVNRVGADGNNIAHCGNSMVIDALGTVLYQKENEEAIFTIMLQKEALQEVRKKYPFLHDADHFNIINE
ncbi:amidohydrolase [Ilyomonas limi]|jgi:predicted amidohydrolase|uniref:Omega-amidase YafV n=2 Tax=Ilyomonas limi TaxID=2575867 RepID=A0A4U3L3H7_9BACT|nr:amidohydrolase [Ilyomonas limi]